MRGLMNSWAPISGLVCPSRGEPRDLRLLRRQRVARLGGALAHRLAGGESSRRARSANAAAPIRLNLSWAARNCSRASMRRFSRRSHSPYRSRLRASSTAARLRASRSIDSR